MNEELARLADHLRWLSELIEDNLARGADPRLVLLTVGPELQDQITRLERSFT
jgi:hypothetical protein